MDKTDQPHIDTKETIELCEVGGKPGYRKGPNGYCFTFNQNEKSKRRAFEMAQRADSNFRINNKKDENGSYSSHDSTVFSNSGTAQPRT